MFFKTEAACDGFPRGQMRGSRIREGHFAVMGRQPCGASCSWTARSLDEIWNQYVQATYAGCAPIPSRSSNSGECANFGKNILKLALTENFDAIVLSANWTGYPSILPELLTVIAELVRNQRFVIVIGPTAEFDNALPLLLAGKRKGTTPIPFSPPELSFQILPWNWTNAWARCSVSSQMWPTSPRYPKSVRAGSAPSCSITMYLWSGIPAI